MVTNMRQLEYYIDGAVWWFLCWWIDIVCADLSGISPFFVIVRLHNKLLPKFCKHLLKSMQLVRHSYLKSLDASNMLAVAWKPQLMLQNSGDWVRTNLWMLSHK